MKQKELESLKRKLGLNALKRGVTKEEQVCLSFCQLLGLVHDSTGAKRNFPVGLCQPGTALVIGSCSLLLNQYIIG